MPETATPTWGGGLSLAGSIDYLAQIAEMNRARADLAEGKCRAAEVKVQYLAEVLKTLRDNFTTSSSMKPLKVIREVIEHAIVYAEDESA